MQAMGRSFQLLVYAGVIVAGCAAALGITPVLSQTKQEHVHEMGQTVMPFKMKKTVHIFRMTDSGGVQSVVIKDTRQNDQIGLIRQHLQHEAKAFSRGGYADPISLHSATMASVSELVTHYQEITVSSIQSYRSERQSPSRLRTGIW